MKISKLLFALLAVISLSCTDETIEGGPLEFNFFHKAGSEDFQYNTVYQNAAGNEFSLRLWRTYITEIQLVDTEGSITAFTPSYHLIEPKEGNKFTFSLPFVKQDEYAAINFNIGIREDTNLSESTSGNLDPSNNMAWNWTTGYKFIRMDGEFEDNAGNRRGVVVHIGTENNFKPQSFTFQTPLVVNASGAELNFELDLLEAFQNPNTIDFEQLSDFQFNNEADLIGENYAEGFIKLAD
ncbi:MbnP family protein [uncultured Marivirga sp.]|uniref:MbnP family protein n=1 Tax=uncultured Marivirga sp. TaxID=1123707 RepID=UPI0030EE9A33|tara:strand:- start:24013 stop:24729 length:717 start_codon:yes stop_codon:yes gene_type:complete